MAHPQQLDFIRNVKSQFPRFFHSSRILEIGSLDINGSIRSFFTNCVYVGIDIGPGPGVDVICSGDDYKEPDSSFDSVVSTECFEHTPKWVNIFKNMARLARSGGLIIMTCAGPGRPEHGTARCFPKASPFTEDYYRNISKEEFMRECNIAQQFRPFSCVENGLDLQFWGIKL